MAGILNLTPRLLWIFNTKDKTILDDDYMFRTLTFGIMGALWLHTLALKQCTTNDRIRGIFKN